MYSGARPIRAVFRINSFPAGVGALKKFAIGQFLPSLDESSLNLALLIENGMLVCGMDLYSNSSFVAVSDDTEKFLNSRRLRNNLVGNRA
jgi:hypothetical protein